MAHPLIADTQEKNLYWRGPVAYFRKRIERKDHWESMGELGLDTARRLVREKRKAAALESYLDTWDTRRKRSEFSTIGELFAAYDAFAAGSTMSADTARANKAALGNVLRTLHGKKFDVEGARLDALDVAAVRDYEARTIANRKAKGAGEGWDVEEIEEQLAKAQRTAGSVWNQAKSLFAADALASTPYGKLILPDLDALRKLSIGSSTIVSYRRPPQTVLSAIAAAVPGLKKTNPAAWLAFNLEANVGMRRRSCVWAKWDWLQERGLDLDGVPVWMMRVNVAKGNSSEVRIDPTFAGELLAFKKPGAEFILPGDEAARDSIFSELVHWLRSKGLQDYEKPNHELRKWCVDTMHKTHGIDEAQSLAGHGDQKLTRAVYVSHKTTKFVRVV